MRMSFVLGLVAASGIIGFAIGMFWSEGETPDGVGRDVDTVADGPGGAGSRDGDRDGEARAESSARTEGGGRRTFDDRSRGEAGAGEGDTGSLAQQALTTEEELELERLRSEVSSLREERAELMGEPIEAPPSSAPRFSAAAMSSAVGQALVSEKVPGDVEGTDCAEYPCIVFGRLEGDEEDMEEIERSAALSPYADDVLTLLFWATSVEEGAAAKVPETGLFALAFYTVDDRQARGERLDRRIRARVMEYWNTDRPGQPG